MKKEKDNQEKDPPANEEKQPTNKNKKIIKEVGTFDGFLVYENKDKIKDSELNNKINININNNPEPIYKDWLIMKHNHKKAKSRFSQLFQEILENDRKIEEEENKEKNKQQIENYLLPNDVINDIEQKDEIKINENDNNIINDDSEIDDIDEQMENLNINNSIYKQNLNNNIIINQNEININKQNNNNNYNFFSPINNDININNNLQNNNIINNNFSNINNINNCEKINLNNIPNNYLMKNNNNIILNQNQNIDNNNSYNNINNFQYSNNMNRKFINSNKNNNNSNSNSRFPSISPTTSSSFDRRTSSFMSNSSGVFSDKNNIQNNNTDYLFFTNKNSIQEPKPKNKTSSSGKKFDVNIDIKRIIHLEDRRTTLMIKNIPNKFKKDLLLNIINQNFKTAYDLFILPTDSHKYKNFGYSFINFTCSYYIPYFYFLFHKKKWSSTNSQKICEITYSKIQGRNNLLSHYAKNIIYKNEHVFNNDISEQKYIIPNEYFTIFNNAFPNYNIEKFETYFITKMPFRY